MRIRDYRRGEVHASRSDGGRRRSAGVCRPFHCSGPLGALAAATAYLLLAGCSQTGELTSAMLAGSGTGAEAFGAPPSDPAQAVAHWNKVYTSNPRDLDAALGYAQSLKATGEKMQALAVLQQVSPLFPDDRRLASEYGRLALELDQMSVAKPLLAKADDAANPDWRVIMARGTLLAKEGQYREAASYYERALALKPDHPSIMSNLALAYTMSGDAAKGEELLRRASASSTATPKVRQNLALVLGLQGKHDEAKSVASADPPADKAQANIAALQTPSHTEAAKSAATAGPRVTAADISTAWDTGIVEAPAPKPAKPHGSVAARSQPKAKTLLVRSNPVGNIVNAEAAEEGPGRSRYVIAAGKRPAQEDEAESAPALSFEAPAAGALGCLRQSGGC